MARRIRAEAWPAAMAVAAGFTIARRRLRDEWRGLPFARLSPHLRPSGLAATPRDFRPTEPDLGRAILGGRFTLAGATLEVGVDGSPWTVASPNRAFAIQLHRFAWL